MMTQTASSKGMSHSSLDRRKDLHMNGRFWLGIARDWNENVPVTGWEPGELREGGSQEASTGLWSRSSGPAPGEGVWKQELESQKRMGHFQSLPPRSNNHSMYFLKCMVFATHCGNLPISCHPSCSHSMTILLTMPFHFISVVSTMLDGYGWSSLLWVGNNLKLNWQRTGGKK
jgi:hypothetical protein